MNTAVNNRLLMTKAVLWFVVGVAGVVAVMRFIYGLGLVTALSDATPWGLWIGFDVLAGVALAAGGFVIAATVHIFHLERYHGIVRPAILTAWLGYLMVALAVFFDIGRYWNGWRPLFNWQGNSALFEVGMCVMTYLVVLTVELFPALLHGLDEYMEGGGRVAAILRRARRLMPYAERLVRVLLPLFIVAAAPERASCFARSALNSSRRASTSSRTSSGQR